MPKLIVSDKNAESTSRIATESGRGWKFDVDGGKEKSKHFLALSITARHANKKSEKDLRLTKFWAPNPNSTFGFCFIAHRASQHYIIDSIEFWNASSWDKSSKGRLLIVDGEKVVFEEVKQIWIEFKLSQDWLNDQQQI